MRRMAMSALLVLASAGGADAEDFFKNKTITIINSTGNGGSYHNIALASGSEIAIFLIRTGC